MATIDDEGETLDSVIETPPGVEEQAGDYVVDTNETSEGQGEILAEPPEEPRKFYVDDGDVEVIGHLVYDLDTDGKKLQVVKYTEYSGRTVRTLYLRSLASSGEIGSQREASPMSFAACRTAWSAAICCATSSTRSTAFTSVAARRG